MPDSGELRPGRGAGDHATAMTTDAGKDPEPRHPPAGGGHGHEGPEEVGSGHAHGGSDGSGGGHGHGPLPGGGGGHSHGAILDRQIASHRRAVRAVWASAAVLALTAAVQLVVVAATGSAGLFADALHNVGDVAGTTVLLIALRLGRRPPTRRFPYGWGRAEDLAGLVIVVAIAVSGGLALWESAAALLGDGHAVRHPAAALLAALLGAAGNEGVALYKIRVGRAIGSVSLEADGQHARVDGLVSLGAAAGVAGAWLGAPAADPVAGLAIGAVIVGILVRTGRQVLARSLDGIEPDLLARIRGAAAGVGRVRGIHDVRARYVGRDLLVQLHIELDGGLTLREAHRIGEEVRHGIVHAVPAVAGVDVHFDPAGEAHRAHAPTAHHFGEGPSAPPGA